MSTTTRREEIDRPGQDWLTEDEIYEWICSRGARLKPGAFASLVGAGAIRGRRALNRQNVLYPWRSAVMLLWDLELGELPDVDEPPPPRSRRATENRDDSP